MQALNISHSYGWLSWTPLLLCFMGGIHLITVILSFQGKVFPKLRNRVPQGSGSSDSVSDKEEDEATDYVFRILFPNSQSEFGESLVPSETKMNMSRAHGAVSSCCIFHENVAHCSF